MAWPSDSRTAAAGGVALAGFVIALVATEVRKVPSRRNAPAPAGALRAHMPPNRTRSPGPPVVGQSTERAGSVSAASVRSAPVRSAVLLQLLDCSSNLRMLDLLHRATVRDAIALVAVWNAGAASDSAHIRALLPPWTSHVPILPLPVGVLHELRGLGHTSTPALVVLDQAGRVRFVSQSPRSSREIAGLKRIIEGLTWFEDT